MGGFVIACQVASRSLEAEMSPLPGMTKIHVMLALRQSPAQIFRDYRCSRASHYCVRPAPLGIGEETWGATSYINIHDER